MKKSFNPEYLPLHLESNEVIEILKKETEARVKLAQLNSMLDRSVIKNEVLMLFSLDESIQSTKIEGTRATFIDVMESEVSGKRTHDVQEVDNYFRAIEYGYKMLSTIPISTRFFHQLHKIILENSRGKNRNPGQYRKIQNFIGPTNRIEDATYIPPEPQKIDQLISNLEKYINNEYQDDLGYLARAAVIHAQFESIHPYLDGNGRLGRILIIFYLINTGVLNSPTFFISEELERSKFKYYGLLNNLRTPKPQWREWIIYFMDSAIRQADNYIGKLGAIEQLHRELVSFADSRNINVNVVNAIFKKPFFTIKDMQNELGVSYNTAKKYTDVMVESGRVFSDDRKTRRVYRFYDLIDLMR